MTTIKPVHITCAICGTESVQNVLASTNQMGYADLDLRPPPMARYTLEYQIQECPSCRYCAPDLTKAHENGALIIQSDEYIECISDTSAPDLVRRFLSYAHYMKLHKNFQEAFFANLKASWVCDDKGIAKTGSQCRRKAIEYLLLCKMQGDLIWEEPGLYELVLANLYRRTATFHEGMEIVLAGALKATDPVIKSALEFTGSLIDRWDTLQYSFGDVVGIQEENQRQE